MLLSPFTAHLGLGAACHGVSDIPHHVKLVRALESSVAVASHGFLWQIICRLPSPPLFFAGPSRGVRMEQSPEVSLRACEAGIDQLRVSCAPNRYLSDLRRCDGFRDSWSLIPAKSCVSYNFLDSPACRPFVLLPLRLPPPRRARRRRTVRSLSHPSLCSSVDGKIHSHAGPVTPFPVTRWRPRFDRVPELFPSLPRQPRSNSSPQPPTNSNFGQSSPTGSFEWTGSPTPPFSAPIRLNLIHLLPPQPQYLFQPLTS